MRGCGRPTAAWRVTLRAVLAGLSLVAVLLVMPVSFAMAKGLSGSMTIAAGADYVRGADVVLSSLVRGASSMRFKNVDGTYSAWEPYASQKAWTLSPGDGVKSVEAQYRGATGGRLTLVDSVTLDSTGPVTSAVYDTLTGRSVSVTLEPVDVLSGVAGTWFRVDGGPWHEGTTVTLWLQRKRAGGLSPGVHVLEYYSADVLGNVADVDRLIVTLE